MYFLMTKPLNILLLFEVVNHSITRNEWVSPSDTCVGAEEALAQRDVVTGVAAWDRALLLLLADEIAWLAPKHSRLLQFSVAILLYLSSVEKDTGRSESEATEERQHRSINVVEESPEGTIRAVIPLEGCFHFVMSRLLILRLGKWMW